VLPLPLPLLLVAVVVVVICGDGCVVFHSKMCSESSHAVIADVTQVAMRHSSSNLHFDHRPSPAITPNMSNITHH
jgi:hypothetical protein